MMTFSINIGQVDETTCYPLTGDLSGEYFKDLLDRLPDNSIRKIEPIDIRDSIFSIWSSTPFKLTSVGDSDKSYIGIDTLNPIDNDLKTKILIGKKEYLSNDIMNQTINDSDYDIIFYNTKDDNQNQDITKLSILSGGVNFLNVPFIQSQYINISDSINFYLVSNNLNISSDNILINDYKLPNSLSASNNKFISWNESDNSMIYEDLANKITSTIGTSSQSLEIFGDPTFLNDYELSFSDNRKATVNIGDIKLGNSFDDIALSEILKAIIYKYLPPFSNVKILSPYQNGYSEVGTKPNVILQYSIYKRTLPTIISGLTNMIPNSYPPITEEGYSYITATASGIISTPLNTSGVNFSVSVSDGTQSYVASTNIRGIYPYFYGYLPNNTINSGSLIQLDKLIQEKSDKNIIIQPGSGFFYFIYDSLYGNLDEILDQNNVQITDFDDYSQTLSSPSGLWVNKSFKVYRIDNLSNSFPIILKFKY